MIDNECDVCGYWIYASGTDQAHVCLECWEDTQNSACGWAFDAGMREAERDRARAFYERMFTRDIAQREEIAGLRARIGRIEEHIRNEGCGCDDVEYERGHESKDCLWAVLDGAPAPMEG